MSLGHARVITRERLWRFRGKVREPRSSIRLSSPISLRLTITLVALVCVGCKTYMTEEEWEVYRAQEQYVPNRLLEPGSYGTWKP